VGLSLDEFVAASKPKRQACSVSLLFDALKPKDRAVLQGVLADPTVSHAAIESVLKRNGHAVAQSTVSRHRRGECTCGG